MTSPPELVICCIRVLQYKILSRLKVDDVISSDAMLVRV